MSGLQTRSIEECSNVQNLRFPVTDNILISIVQKGNIGIDYTIPPSTSIVSLSHLIRYRYKIR